MIVIVGRRLYIYIILMRITSGIMIKILKPIYNLKHNDVYIGSVPFQSDKLFSNCSVLQVVLTLAGLITTYQM